MDQTLIGQFDSHELHEQSRKDDVKTKTDDEALTEKYFNIGERVLIEMGLVDIVYPNGRPSNNDGGVSFQDKLREYTHYMPLQTYQAPDVPEGIFMSSPEGRAMLQEALDTPYMEAFYKVAHQVDNQLENTCGSSSLVVVLNSLGIDPGCGTWYGEYNWNHLGSLACCTPNLQNPNITLDQFSRLAVCNNARAYPVIVTDDWTVDDLRTWVKMSCSRPDIVMVANYGRALMKQLGSGHFLPFSGYHEGKDMLLMVDIAKHKYDPQWLPLDMLVGAIKARDDRTGMNRGFVILMGPDFEPSERMFGPSITFRIDDVPGTMNPALAHFVAHWNRFLDSKALPDICHREVIRQAVQNITSFIKGQRVPSVFTLLEMTLGHFRSDHRGSPSIVARCRRPQCPEACPNIVFYRKLESLMIFQNVMKCLESMTNEERGLIMDLVVTNLIGVDEAIRATKATCYILSSMNRTVEFFKDVYSKTDRVMGSPTNVSSGKNPDQFSPFECPGYIELFPEHILSFILLCWPYLSDNQNLYGQNDFLVLFNKYDLAHFDVEQNNNIEPAHTNKRKRQEYEPVECMEKRKTFREHLDQMIGKEIQKLQSCRVSREQVGAMKQKISVVLDYHHLLE